MARTHKSERKWRGKMAAAYDAFKHGELCHHTIWVSYYNCLRQRDRLNRHQYWVKRIMETTMPTEWIGLMGYNSEVALKRLRRQYVRHHSILI